MQKIIPHLWFDKEAKEAVEFYTPIFGDHSTITNITTLYGTPSGDADFISFTLAGQEFMAISAGPLFRFNPSVSFTVHCKTKEEVDELWNRLLEGGSALMPLDSYPFSERYGWLQDKYGLSWQIMFDKEVKTQKITPSIMFVGNVCGKAEEAINYYVSVFENANVGYKMKYEKGEEPDVEGTVKYASFTLESQDFSAMDSAHVHNFSFNEAISFMVYCETQEEIDYYWEKLSAVPEAEQCGWLKDKYGFSWQIVPKRMDEMMLTDNKEKLASIMKSFLKMKKFNLAELEKAYEGN